MTARNTSAMQAKKGLKMGKVQRQVELDGLRAIACLIVVVLHAVILQIPQTTDALRGIPKIGVWLFFALSSYLLTLRFLTVGIQWRDFARYMSGRARRIIPPMIIAIMIYWLLGYGGILSGGDFFSAVTMQGAYAHFWTLPVEFKAYVVLFPVVLIATIAEKRFGTFSFPAVLAAVVALASFYFPPQDTPEADLWPQWYALNFLSGSLAAWVVHRSMSKWARAVGTCGAFALVLFTLVVKTGLAGDPVAGLVDKHYVYGPLWAMIIVGAVAQPASWLRSRLLSSIGASSYSIYLYHWAIISAFIAYVPVTALPWTVPLSVILSVAVGLLWGRWLEDPFRFASVAYVSGASSSTARPSPN